MYASVIDENSKINRINIAINLHGISIAGSTHTPIKCEVDAQATDELV